MVPVTEALAKSYAAQLLRLQACFLKIATHISAEAGFVHYVFNQVADWYRPNDLPAPVTPSLSSFSTAPELASVGYRAAMVPSDITSQEKQEWISTFDRLRGRDPFPADRQAFTFRPLELFGVCLGAACIGIPAEHQRWLASLFPQLPRLLRDNWSLWLSAASKAALGIADQTTVHVRPGDSSLDELGLLLWLKESRTYANRGFWAELGQRELQEAVLAKCATSEPEPLDAARATLIYFGLKSSVNALLRSHIAESWQVGRPEKDALELVTTICRRFHGFVRQLLNRHDNRETLQIRDEYDVQDLLRGLLSLYFDDVREEEWTPSYAGNSSRTDFLLWREHLVVEAKMTRKGLDQKKVADELIIDKERYRAHDRCRMLLCFVYDPEHRCKNPAALENDLRQEEDPLVRVIVAPRD